MYLTENPRRLGEVMTAITINQERWRKARSPRKKWRLVEENEALFAELGVFFEPMERPRGIYGWWIRRGWRARP